MDRTTKEQQTSPCSDLYSVDINGGSIQKLIENVGCFELYENKIFYEPSSFVYSYGQISMYDIDSREKKDFEGCCLNNSVYCIAYGNLYFYNEEDGAVVSIDIKSGKKKIIEYTADLGWGGLTSVGQYLFYVTGDGLRAYDFINDKYYNTVDVIGYVVSSNRNLYFETGDADADYFQLIKISGGKVSTEDVKGLN